MRTLNWILGWCSILCCIGCIERSTPGAFIERYVALHRSGDVEGLLALHAADAEFLIPGQQPVRGTEALRALFEWDAVLGSQLIMEGISADGDTILIESIVERNKWFQAIGLAEARHKPGTRIVLREGRILGIYPAAFDDGTQSRVIEQLDRVVGWLSANRPDTLERLLPGGKFRYDAASAGLWLEVLEEWNKTGR